MASVLNSDLQKSYGQMLERLRQLSWVSLGISLATNSSSSKDRPTPINTQPHTNDTNKNPASAKTTTGEVKLKSLLHKTIKKVTEDIESYKFNTAISAMMIFLNELEKEMGMSRFNLDIFEIFLKLLAPFAPHITEEIWSKMGHKDSIHLEKWPEADLSKIKEENLIEN